MEQKIERILEDLYAIDPALRDREDDVKKAIKSLLEGRPEAELDPAFERRLREKLLASFSEKKGPLSRLRDFATRPAFRMGLGIAAALCVAATALIQFMPAGSGPIRGAAGATLSVSPQSGESQASAAKVTAAGKVALAAPQMQKPGRSPLSPPVARAAARSAPPAALASGSDRGLGGATLDEKDEVFGAAPAPAAPWPAAEKKPAASSTLDVLGNRFNQSFNTEGYDSFRENAFVSTLDEPLSTFSIDVDTASYANVRRFLNEGSLPPSDAVRIEELVNYFSYDYAGPSGSEPFGFDTELASCPWMPSHLLLRVALQARQIPSAQLPPSNLVFLVDVSGSMDEENKLPLVRESLKLLVKRMRQQDRIALVVYAGSAGLVLPSTPGSEKEKIVAAIDSLDSGGSTAGGEGIMLAYETARKAFIAKGNNRVILATDGDFNVGASSEGELVRLIEAKRREGVFLTVLGFGMGNYQDSKMQKLADSGNGNYAYIDTLSEAEKVLSKQMAGTLYAVAKDVKLQIEFNPALVGSYRLLGYEKRALATRDFADDSKDAGELGAGSSVTALYELIPSADEAPKRDLRYQSSGPSQAAAAAAATGELMTLKFRYKKPDGDTSALIEQPVRLAAREFDKASLDFRFAAAVAEWGLVLRQSEYKEGANIAQVIDLATAAQGRDSDGYRAEFLRLAQVTSGLEKQDSH